MVCHGADRHGALHGGEGGEHLRKGQPILLNSMSPRDRRIVHQALNDNGKVKTKSIGEGHYKRVEISPK